MEKLSGLQVSEPANPQRSKRKRQVLIFLFCIGIALILWFLRAFENRYQTEIHHPVTVVNLPEGYILASPLPKKLALEVEGLGFSVLKHNWTWFKEPLPIDFRQVWPVLPRNPQSFTDTLDLRNYTGSFSLLLGDLTVTGFKNPKLVISLVPGNQEQ